jgi:2-polyprenyl-3-methyl-5-hydroxy-6-metoxy-1,4-benzoquinol methylase
MSSASVLESAAANDASIQTCWICGLGPLRLYRPGNLPPNLGAEHFRITDSAYGCTADIYQCEACGFRQCGSLTEVLPFYEDMSDDAYEHSRDARSLQARELLRHVAKYRSSGRLLDVGAGSGILVDAALKLGFEAEGIEPSGPLSGQAAERGLPVSHGILPSRSVRGLFDVITVVDVIEHVSDPIGLMRSVHEQLASDGIAVVVTPDVGSLMARVLGRRWWHYRIAHIGYFNRDTLAHALRLAGFEQVATMRPAWYFPVSYLIERALTYVPETLRFEPPAFLERITMPLNLFDSLLVVLKKR